MIEKLRYGWEAACSLLFLRVCQVNMEAYKYLNRGHIHVNVAAAATGEVLLLAFN